MTESLSVDINRRTLHEVEAPERFVTASPFRVEFVNHGEAVHVHLHPDDALSEVIRLKGSNHYVEGGSSKAVEVDVSNVDEVVRGRLEVVSGYGAETASVDVTVEPAQRPKDPVEVDETLGQPRGATGGSAGDGSGTGVGFSLPGGGTLSLVGLAAVAVLVALGVGVLVSDPLILLLVGVVIGGVLASLFFVIR